MCSAARAAAERSLQILHSLKAFVKIRRQIVDMFRPDGQPDRVGPDALVQQLLPAQPGIRYKKAGSRFAPGHRISDAAPQRRPSGERASAYANAPAILRAREISIRQHIRPSILCSRFTVRASSPFSGIPVELSGL